MLSATLEKTAAPAAAPAPEPVDLETRYSRLFKSLRGPARGMVRRAFGSAFSDDDLDDLYSSAWLSTLAALRRRPRRLSDEELRRYLMTAVANQASRELRRRGRKPTLPIDAASSAADPIVSPDEAATQAEGARLTRELIGSLPPRRRAVLVFRYGWGLQPEEVRGLIDGLSPRAYRKEVERGVAEIAGKMRMVEDGEWCQSREPLLRALAAGLAGEDEERQAKQHLAHCRSCAGFVGRLSGHLHDLGGAVALGGVAEAFGPGGGALLSRLAESVEHGKQAIGSVFGRGAEPAEQATGQLLASGGASGAGAAGTGGVLAAAGGKAVAGVCAGATATACVAAGVVPGVNLGDLGGREPEPAAIERELGVDRSAEISRLSSLAIPDQPAPDPQPPQPQPEPPSPAPEAPAPAAPEPAPDQTVSSPSPVVEEFEPVGTPAGAATSSAASQSTNEGGGGSPSGADFGP